MSNRFRIRLPFAAQRFPLLLLSLLALTSPAGAGIYRWVEGDDIHYGNQPPPGVSWVTFNAAGYRTSDWEQERLDLLRQAVIDSNLPGVAAGYVYIEERQNIRDSLCELYSRYYQDAYDGLHAARLQGPALKYLYKSMRQYAARKALYC